MTANREIISRRLKDRGSVFVIIQTEIRPSSGLERGLLRIYMRDNLIKLFYEIRSTTFSKFREIHVCFTLKTHSSLANQPFENLP